MIPKSKSRPPNALPPDEQAKLKSRQGVRHPDGYIQLKDRSKDIIISGGENISSIEVEEALYLHPAVAIVAVVAMPHEKWGETPCAFVELATGETVDPATLRAWCKDQLAPYKVPGQFVFMPIPRTSTGKIQKFVLRDQAEVIAQNADAGQMTPTD